MGFEQFGLELGLLVVGHLHIPHTDHTLDTLDRILDYNPPDRTHNFGHSLDRIHILVARSELTISYPFQCDKAKTVSDWIEAERAQANDSMFDD